MAVIQEAVLLIEEASKIHGCLVHRSTNYSSTALTTSIQQISNEKFYLGSPFASPILKSLGGRGVRGGVIDFLSDHHYPIFFRYAVIICDMIVSCIMIVFSVKFIRNIVIFFQKNPLIVKTFWIVYDLQLITVNKVNV